MTKVSAEIQIDAARSRVWDTLADIGAIQTFHPGVKQSYTLEGPSEGVGAGRHCDLKPMGSVDERVIEWREGEALGLDIIGSKGMPKFRGARGTFLLTEWGDGRTSARFEFDYELRGGVIGRLIDSLMMRQQFRRMVPQVLKGLKRHVEQAVN